MPIVFEGANLILTLFEWINYQSKVKNLDDGELEIETLVD